MTTPVISFGEAAASFTFLGTGYLLAQKWPHLLFTNVGRVTLIAGTSITSVGAYIAATTAERIVENVANLITRTVTQAIFGTSA